MKVIGYIIIFLLVVVILIPFVIIKGCSTDGQRPHEKNYSEEKIDTIKVYVTEKDEVVQMDFSEYLKGVVAAEMPASFHIEALKAQAVAARTYVYHRLMKQKESHIDIPEHKGADICTDPSHCKAWISADKAKQKWGIFSSEKYWNKIDEAVNETASIIITYKGKPIDAVFHSTNGGKTENSEDVWENTVPYLRSVFSQGEQLSPKYVSTVQVSIEEFKEKLKSINPAIEISDDIISCISEIKRSEGGSVETIRIGGFDIKGTDIRKLFNLNSSNFSIRLEGNEVILDVKGNGHGVGMSQYGANFLANNGNNYEQILKHYYKEVELKKIED